VVLAPLVTADQEVGEEYYLLWRLEQGVAEGSTEIPEGNWTIFVEVLNKAYTQVQLVYLV
jgi:hypothetical protein